MRPSATAAAFLPSTVVIFLNLAGGDLGDHNGLADGVGGALLALNPRPNEDAEPHEHRQTEYEMRPIAEDFFPEDSCLRVNFNRCEFQSVWIRA